MQLSSLLTFITGCMSGADCASGNCVGAITSGVGANTPGVCM